jgi:hypothetical protein
MGKKVCLYLKILPITRILLPINDGNLSCLCTALNHITKILNELLLIPTIFDLNYVEIKFPFIKETNISN